MKIAWLLCLLLTYPVFAASTQKSRVTKTDSASKRVEEKDSRSLTEQQVYQKSLTPGQLFFPVLAEIEQAGIGDARDARVFLERSGVVADGDEVSSHGLSDLVRISKMCHVYGNFWYSRHDPDLTEKEYWQNGPTYELVGPEYSQIQLGRTQVVINGKANVYGPNDPAQGKLACLILGSMWIDVATRALLLDGAVLVKDGVYSVTTENLHQTARRLLLLAFAGRLPNRLKPDPDEAWTRIERSYSILTNCIIPTTKGLMAGKETIRCGGFALDQSRPQLVFGGQTLLSDDTVWGRKVSLVENRQAGSQTEHASAVVQSRDQSKAREQSAVISPRR